VELLIGTPNIFSTTYFLFPRNVEIAAENRRRIFSCRFTAPPIAMCCTKEGRRARSSRLAVLTARKLLIMRGNRTNKTHVANETGPILGPVAGQALHFLPLFCAQFFFCVAEIFALAAADILCPTLPRFPPPNASIAVSIPFSLLTTGPALSSKPG
jgi:hypothetical protein